MRIALLQSEASPRAPDSEFPAQAQNNRWHYETTKYNSNSRQGKSKPSFISSILTHDTVCNTSCKLGTCMSQFNSCRHVFSSCSTVIHHELIASQVIKSLSSWLASISLFSDSKCSRAYPTSISLCSNAALKLAAVYMHFTPLSEPLDCETLGPATTHS